MRRSPHAETSLRRRSVYTVTLVATFTAAGLTQAVADIPNGKLRAYIRSSGHPCAHVIEQQQLSEKADGTKVLEVRCNSGLFKVTAKNGVPQEVTPQ